MKLIVGLGNPGSQYERTRHNVGFMAVDLFAQKHGATNFRVAHESFMADVLVGGGKGLLLKPETYMNLSGLRVGVIGLRATGWAGGHKGLKDIEAAMSGFAGQEGKKPMDYARLRIGVDL